ncbi:galactosylceramide sulfotransferase-like [Mytilus galloprovincialis]|uniref:galactosylceramide sulfotransferase-like n=1 Tax=Mytilus galloprovincialis TaxID=29158 RepID=UPI003F7B8CC5
MINIGRKFKRSFILLMKALLIGAGFQIPLYFYVGNFTKKDYISTENSVSSEYGIEVCTEKRNFVFIKCMKCATETMATIIRRFGYKRVLNFVLPVKNNIYLGWPYIMEKSDYRPSKWPYNIIFEHSVYNSSVMSALMPNDTVYITSIREPWNRLVSSFQYFRIGDIAEVPKNNFTEYVKNIEKYDKTFSDPKKHKFRGCIADNFSLVQNLQGHCLGMPLGFPKERMDISKNLTAIKEYINHIEKQFSLVMIVEYMYESLILLKRMMCWSLQDILHHSSNVLGVKQTYAKGNNYNIYKNYSHIDFIIYDHFNATFWRKVKAQGQDFYDELDHFKLIQMLINQFCFVEGNTKPNGKFLTIPKSRFNSEFNFTSDECGLMSRYLLIDLREQYDRVEQPKKEDLTGKWEEPPRGCSYPIPNH